MNYLKSFLGKAERNMCLTRYTPPSPSPGQSSKKGVENTEDHDVAVVGLRRSKRIKERVRKRRAVVRKKKPSKADEVAHALAHIIIFA